MRDCIIERSERAHLFSYKIADKAIHIEVDGLLKGKIVLKILRKPPCLRETSCGLAIFSEEAILVTV